MARRTTRHSAKQKQRNSFQTVATRLSEIGREFHGRGWALGTSGNFSAVISRNPMRMAITATGIDKSDLNPDEILEVSAGGPAGKGPSQNLESRALDSKLRNSKPRNSKTASSNVASWETASAETLLHVTIARARGAGAVLHTHSVWGTILSEEYAAQGGVPIEGYEMLKGLTGVRTHEHREWVPILENQQDMTSLAKTVAGALQEHSAAHAFLLRGHGLYTWGRNLEEARRHVEILEFLLEVLGRRLSVLWRRKASHFRSRPRVAKQA